MDVAGPEMRNVTVLLNVQEAKKLPQAGVYLSQFLTNLTKEHGLFAINVAVSVDPVESTAFGAAQVSQGLPSDIEIVVIPEGDE